MTTFYRVHWSNLLPFNAEHAWSSLTGVPRSEDGTKSECPACDCTGENWDPCPTCNGKFPATDECERCDGTGLTAECQRCDGTGWEPCLRGYSCYESAEQLISYYSESGREGMVPADEPVIIFEGWQADTGFDDEPTVVPERVIETLTWAELVARFRADLA
ncbi:hypothetical protein AB0L80_39315 [Streptomyces sp. NPDC052069]|uniref:hypothetical protein n=1 Tax=Streptomyces sp. NPDC052069 TaxID=3154650 RepID=UPI0034223E77